MSCAILFMAQTFHDFTNFGDIHENKIVNFPQPDRLVGTSTSSNLVYKFCKNKIVIISTTTNI